MELPKIKTKEDLKKLLNYLYDQGFGYFSDWEHHQKKITHIINKNNTLNIKYDKKLDDEMNRLTDYDEIENQVKQYFLKFSPDDKIFELFERFNIQSDDSCSLPSNNYPDIKEIIKWNEFKNKYKLKDEYINTGGFLSFAVYNLDKNFLKIRFGDESYHFNTLYKLIFNEEPSDINKVYGEWQNIGKIEIKKFQNGYANIKGDIKKFKDYYYKYLTQKIYYHTIIIYNKKQEIFKKIERD